MASPGLKITSCCEDLKVEEGLNFNKERFKSSPSGEFFLFYKAVLGFFIRLSKWTKRRKNGLFPVIKVI